MLADVNQSWAPASYVAAHSASAHIINVFTYLVYWKRSNKWICTKATKIIGQTRQHSKSDCDSFGFNLQMPEWNRLSLRSQCMRWFNHHYYGGNGCPSFLPSIKSAAIDRTSQLETECLWFSFCFASWNCSHSNGGVGLDSLRKYVRGRHKHKHSQTHFHVDDNECLVLLPDPLPDWFWQLHFGASQRSIYMCTHKLRSARKKQMR